MTTVSIAGEDFLIDGTPTYAGRSFEGRRIEGLLFNVRAVQATFDDANPGTRGNWAYPDTGTWDPERNVAEFCEALSTWRDRGILAVTINCQGGGALYSPDIYRSYDNSAFTRDGELKPDYAARIRRVIERADELGMIVIVGLFYMAHLDKLDGAEAIDRAAANAVDFLGGIGTGNILVELANEADAIVGSAKPEDKERLFLIDPLNAHLMIETLRKRQPQLLYSTSTVLGIGGAGFPPESLYSAADYILVHGNLCDPESLGRYLRKLRSLPAFIENPKPIVINEDSPDSLNLDASWPEHVSWGYYDQGNGRVLSYALPREDAWELLSGYQTPPVHWGINTAHKRTFFDRVAEVTGNQVPPTG